MDRKSLEQLATGYKAMVDQVILGQVPILEEATDKIAEAYMKGKLTSMFGSGHSRMQVEEMFPRHASYALINAMIELSITNHTNLSGSNTQRTAMQIEKYRKLAKQILKNFDLQQDDLGFIVSNSGGSGISVEMAKQMKEEKGMYVIALVSDAYYQKAQSTGLEEERLWDYADLVIDNGAPYGDGMVYIPKFQYPLGSGSSVGGCAVVNAIKVLAAEKILEQGGTIYPLIPVGTAKYLDGEYKGDVTEEERDHMFDAAYDFTTRNICELNLNLGLKEEERRLIINPGHPLYQKVLEMK